MPVPVCVMDCMDFIRIVWSSGYFSWLTAIFLMVAARQCMCSMNFSGEMLYCSPLHGVFVVCAIFFVIDDIYVPH